MTVLLKEYYIMGISIITLKIYQEEKLTQRSGLDAWGLLSLAHWVLRLEAHNSSLPLLPLSLFPLCPPPCAYMYMHICMCECISMCALCMPMYVCLFHVCACVYVHVCVYVSASLCVFMSMCICMRAHLYKYSCWYPEWPEVNLGCCSLGSVCLGSWESFTTETYWLSPRNLPASVSPTWGLQTPTITCRLFYVFWGSNSGPQVCATSTFWAEPSLKPQVMAILMVESWGSAGYHVTKGRECLRNTAKPAFRTDPLIH